MAGSRFISALQKPNYHIIMCFLLSMVWFRLLKNDRYIDSIVIFSLDAHIYLSECFLLE